MVNYIIHSNTPEVESGHYHMPIETCRVVTW